MRASVKAAFGICFCSIDHSLNLLSLITSVGMVIGWSFWGLRLHQQLRSYADENSCKDRKSQGLNL